MEVKWIKIVTDIFDDEKILLIESLPEADSIIVCWFKLLCLAGKQNNSGVLMLNERIAYTDEMLATVFRRPLQTVRLALETFERFGMVEVINGAITIPNWGKHQNLDGIEKVREQTRERVARYRDRQKLLTDNVSCNVTETQCNGTEEDKEGEKDKEQDKSSSVGFEVVKAWNSMSEEKVLSQVTKLMPGTERYNLLTKRISEYGVDGVLRAIENVRNSPFLLGENNRGWQVTFDWMIKPNNFPKVLDGNYLDKGKPAKQYMTAEQYAKQERKVLSPDELWSLADKI